MTGGTKGNGAAIVQHFVKAGGQVVAVARSHSAEATKVHIIQADLSTATGAAMTAEQTLDVLGGVDILVNNAGSHTRVSQGALAMTDEDWL